MKKLMMALVAACAAVVAQAATTADYVQENLIACWDGYENNGTAGGHNPNITEWKDVKGNYGFTLNNVNILADRLGFTGNNSCYGVLSADDTVATFEAAKNGTFEIVLISEDDTNQKVALQSSANSGIAFGSLAKSGSNYQLVTTCGTAKPITLFSWKGAVNTFAVTYENASPMPTYVNGAAATMSTSSNNFSSPGNGTILGNRNAKNQAFKGSICAIRLYSTQLTPEQIAANSAVDHKRFVEGDVIPTSRVVVSGSPEEFAIDGEPVYGFNIATNGQKFAFAAPEGHIVQPTGTVVRCTGWKLYDANTLDLVCESDENNKHLCSLTYESPVNLVWQWEAFAPGAEDDLVIADTITVTGPMTCKSLTIKEGGLLKIQAEPAKTPTNLPSVFTDATVVTVTGELKVEYGGRLRPICDTLTGAPVVFKVGSFTLDYGGRVWCDGAGYIWTKCNEAPEGAAVSDKLYTYSPGWPTGYNQISAYGGNGQKKAYGYKYAPFLPGAPASTQNSSAAGKGGGAFVLLSSGTVSLSGLVSCRSTDYGYGNGAGGGIWIVGSDFRVAPCAELVADSGAGGTSYGSNYAGTGGRISLAAGLMDYDIAALANGETPEDLTYTDSLDFITASANAGQGRVDPATAKRTTANRPGTITYVTRGEGTFVTPIPAPEPPPAPVYPDPAGDGQARTFVGEDGGDWDDAANWSPSGVPGNADAVTIDGKWVCASSIVHAASLTVNAGATLTVGGRQQDITAQQPFVESTGVGLKIAGDLTVAGDLSVGGEDSPVPVLITIGGDATVESGGRLAVYAANGFPADPYGRMRMATYDEATVFNVAGALTIDTGATVYPDADLRTGASVHFKASSILLAAGGTINADARGFGYAPINSLDTGTFLSDGGYGCTSTLGTYSPGSGSGTYGSCGGYGGTSQGARYGLANAPFQPGGSSGCYDGSKPKFVRGGGAVWLDAMQAELHGTITALGAATGFNASAGGGVWIVAKAFVSSPELVIQADAVRNGANGYSSYSAGGRIALGIALTDEEEAALLAGTTPETVTVVDGVVGFTATVLGETKSDVQKGNPGTVKTVTGSYVPDTSVTIVGSPKNAVSPAFSYGASIVTAGSTFTLPTIGYGSDPDDPLVRYSYDGWVLKDEDGNEVGSGEEDVSFTVPQGNSTLTIRWTNVESGTLVSVPDATLGTVSVGGVSHDADFTYFITGSAAFTAVPASGAEFLYWVGEVPAGHQLDNPLTIAAGIGRRIQPVFRTAAAATVRAWTGAAGNGLWLDAANWSPEGVPGLNDTVTMAEGLAIVTNFLSVKTLALSGTAHLFAGANIAANSAAEVTGSTHKPYVDPVIEEVAFEVETLTLADSAGFALGGQDEDYPSRKPRLAAGSVNLSGTSILVVTAGATNETDNFETGCGTVAVAGVFEIADTAQFVPASDQYTGGSLVVRTGKFLLGEGATVNAKARGFDYRYYKNPHILAPGQGEPYQRGGGYGGKGGNSNATYGNTYGFEYAPIHPGSCNGGYGDSTGNVYPAGGLIRIHAKSAVLNGTLDANCPDGCFYGGSSGGGIWVTTSGKMEIGAAFVARAKGGTTNYGSGAGGGGRIALGEWLTDAEVAQLAVDGELPIRGAKRKPVPVLAEAEFEALHPGADIDVSTFKDGKPGTFVFLDGKTKGFMLLVK